MSLNNYENNLTKKKIKKKQNQKIVIKLPHKHIPFSWKKKIQCLIVKKVNLCFNFNCKNTNLISIDNAIS